MANHQTVRSVVGVFTILVWIPIRCYCQQGTFAGVKVAPENLHFVGNKSFSSADLRAIFRSAGIVTAKVPPQFIDTYNNDRITHATNVLLTF
jgi:hypothetical protein